MAQRTFPRLSKRALRGKFILREFTCGLFLLLGSASLLAQDEGLKEARELSNKVVRLVEQIRPWVVHIRATGQIFAEPSKTPYFFDGRPLRKTFGAEFERRYTKAHPLEGGTQCCLCSGILLGKDGYVFTSYKGILGSGEIRVLLYDEREARARIVGSDPATDLALLKIEGGGFSGVPLSETRIPRSGEFVVGIGCPFEKNPSVAAGTISVPEPREGLEEGSGDFIRSTISGMPELLGGPLADLDGNVVGINVGLFRGASGTSGAAIPLRVAMKIMDRLRVSGRVDRGYIGILIRDIPPDLAERLGLPSGGVFVESVEKRSPAVLGGIRKGDLILGMDGSEVTGAAQLSQQISSTTPGKEIHLKILRRGIMMTLRVTVGKSPVEEFPRSEGGEISFMGMVLRKPSSLLLEGLGYDRRETGLIVSRIAQGSPAQRAGLQPGELIKQANRKTLTSIEILRGVLDEADEERGVLLLAKSPKRVRFIVLKR